MHKTFIIRSIFKVPLHPHIAFLGPLSVVLRPEEGNFSENFNNVVCVMINKRSFESFMCLDLIL